MKNSDREEQQIRLKELEELHRTALETGDTKALDRIHAEIYELLAKAAGIGNSPKANDCSTLARSTTAGQDVDYQTDQISSPGSCIF
jgi:hypothetical protein